MLFWLAKGIDPLEHSAPLDTLTALVEILWLKGQGTLDIPCINSGEMPYISCSRQINMKKLTLFSIAIICAVQVLNVVSGLPQTNRYRLKYIKMFVYYRLLQTYLNFWIFLRNVEDEEQKALDFLEGIENQSSDVCFQATVASWNYNTNINDINQEKKLNASLDYSKFSKDVWQKMTTDFKSWRTYKDPDLKRKFKKSIVLGASVLPDEELVKVCLKPCKAHNLTVLHN